MTRAPKCDDAAPAASGAGPSLDRILAALHLQPHELQVFDPAHPRVDAQRPLLVLTPQLTAAVPILAERYPAEHTVAALAGDAVVDNLVRLVVFSLTTSLGWDIGRAITTALLVAVAAPVLLRTFRRAARRARFEVAA